MKTIHEYTTPCTKALYEEYGQIETSLLLQDIQSLGVYFPEGFRGNDEKVYHHMLLVMSPRPLENLAELFPGVTSQWTYKKHEYDENAPRSVGPYITSMQKGKLHIDTKDFTVRA